MSSHHIVREKQEPALLVLGLDNFTDELLGQLLEWAPTVITTPQIAEQLMVYGIKIDWIITGNLDDTLQPDVKAMPCGNGDFANCALTWLVASGYPAVNIVTDELNLADFTAFAAQLNLVIFHQNKKIYTITPGFNKWTPAGETIELLSPAEGIQFTGLEQIALQQYKTTHDDFFSLSFDAPFLFIAEYIS
jgi:thiamine pyrophosphokinase